MLVSLKATHHHLQVACMAMTDALTYQPEIELKVLLEALKREIECRFPDLVQQIQNLNGVAHVRSGVPSLFEEQPA